MEAKILRVRARSALAGSWGVSIGIAALAALLGGLITGTSFLPSLDYSIPVHIPMVEEFATAIDQGIRIGSLTLTLRSGFMGLAASIIGGVLQLGYAQFLLKQHDGQDAQFNDLFSQFHRFGTGFAQRFLRILYTSLWSMLLIVPGIIKGYSYAMTPFVLAEYPQLSASQAIAWSEELMNGHKTDLFILDLTFFGWDFLSLLTLNLGHVFLNPYRNAAYAAFYRQLQAEKYYVTCE